MDKTTLSLAGRCAQSSPLVWHLAEAHGGGLTCSARAASGRGDAHGHATSGGGDAQGHATSGGGGTQGRATSDGGRAQGRVTTGGGSAQGIAAPDGGGMQGRMTASSGVQEPAEAAHRGSWPAEATCKSWRKQRAGARGARWRWHAELRDGPTANRGGLQRRTGAGGKRARLSLLAYVRLSWSCMAEKR